MHIIFNIYCDKQLTNIVTFLPLIWYTG